MAATAVPDQAGRLAYVDGLRAIAVLGVVACHAAKYAMDMHQGAVYHILAEGAHGVDLFFVISGLCLSYPTLANLRRTGAASFDVREFFARRIVRIVPPYRAAFFLILAVALVALGAGGQLPWPTVKMPPFWLGVRQLFFVDDGTRLLSGSFWTLAVEFRWYLVFPIILWSYVRAPVLLAAACAGAVAVYDLTSLRLWDLAALPAFVMGIVAADLAVRRLPLARIAPVLFAIAVVASLVLEPKGHLDYALQNQLWWQIACFVLVVAGGANGALRRALSHPAATFVGAASYSIYLLHDPPMGWYGYSGGRSAIAAAAAGVLAGVAFWYLVERPLTAGAGKERLLAPTRSALRGLTGRGRTAYDLGAAHSPAEL